MNPHRDRVAAAVEDSASTFTKRTWTALSQLLPGNRLPGPLIKQHHAIAVAYPDAYTPLTVYGYCMIIAARSSGGCRDYSLAHAAAIAVTKPRYALELTDAVTSKSAALTGIRLIKQRTHGLCIARLWLDLAGLDANKTPIGVSGRSMADRVRNRWNIDIHRT